MNGLEKNNFKKVSLSIFIAFSMIFCSVFFNLKTIEKSYADGDMEYAVDSAEVLTTDELETLKYKLAQISDENNIDVGIVTVEYLDGKTAQEFANDLFEQNKFGKGENRDGILLLVATEDREWAMSTHGSAKEAFNQDGLDYLSGEFLPYLSDDDYYSAFENFLNNAQELGAMYVAGNPYRVEYDEEGNYPIEGEPIKEEGINNSVWIPLSIVIGCAISFVIMMMYKSQLKSVKSESRADDYLIDMKLVKSQDIFLYRTVTRTMRPKNEDHGNNFNNSGGGGGSYGGSSGSF